MADRAGGKDVAFLQEHCGRIDFFATGKSLEHRVFLCELPQCRDIDAVRIEDRPAHIGDGDNFYPIGRKCLGSVYAHIAKALNDGSCFVRRDAKLRQ